MATTTDRLLLTVEEAARRLGRCVRVPLRDLEAWVEDRQQDKPR